MSAPLIKLTGRVSSTCKRNFGIFAPALQQATDPIQKLFIDKIREYKSKSSGGKLVEPSPELEKELKNDKDRVLNQFKIKPGEDITKFPSFDFTDPKIEVPQIPKAE